MSWNFADAGLHGCIYGAEYGIEKESLRVTPGGNLSHTRHPFSKAYIDRDFCENQVEIISSVHNDIDSLFSELKEIQSEVNKTLAGINELSWPFSNPPVVLSNDDIPIAHFEGAQKEREDYRVYLAKKYGKAKMLFSGIHFNFSFSNELLLAAFEQSGGGDFKTFKDNAYMELSRKLLDYIWLIVYLTAASPLMDKSFLKLSGFLESDSFRYASVRCSEAGYWNDFLPILDFSDVNSYVRSIEKYIKSGQLYAASELYYPLRLKPRGKNSTESLVENGINHIELRCLDVNPLSELGLFEEDVRFIHLLLLFLMSRGDVDADENYQRTAIENIKTAALYNDTENRIYFDGEALPLREAAKKAVEKIESFARLCAPVFLPSVEYQKEKLRGKRYAETVRERFADYIPDVLALAEKYRG